MEGRCVNRELLAQHQGTANRVQAAGLSLVLGFKFSKYS